MSCHLGWPTVRSGALTSVTIPLEQPVCMFNLQPGEIVQGEPLQLVAQCSTRPRVRRQMDLVEQRLGKTDDSFIGSIVKLPARVVGISTRVCQLQNPNSRPLLSCMLQPKHEFDSGQSTLRNPLFLCIGCSCMAKQRGHYLGRTCCLVRIYTVEERRLLFRDRKENH